MDENDQEHNDDDGGSCNDGHDDRDGNDEDGGPPICGMDTHGMCHRCPK